MKKYPDFWSVLLGNGPHGFFFGYLAMGCIAAIAMFCILVAGRDKDGDKTPKPWSWRFFWINNLLRIVSTVVVLYLFVRVAYEYVDGVWMILLSIGLGFGFPKLTHIAKQLGILTTNKLSEKFVEILNQKDLLKNQNTQPKP
jgi:branched-subunit amino acid permease